MPREALRPAGSIPACAGETPLAGRWSAAWWVDPRVRGGDPETPRHSARPSGRSPRARGRHRKRDFGRGAKRSIPACAGETKRQRYASRPKRVDPRVRGGDDGVCRYPSATRGRSPRARGRLPASWGSIHRDGSIPACAGETLCQTARRTTRRVDPRVRGGDDGWSRQRGLTGGRSPRARGRRCCCRYCRRSHRSIPACAGETKPGRTCAPGLKVDPRVRGGDRQADIPYHKREGRSPRARGRLLSLFRHVETARSIPACAGETRTAILPLSQLEVDPRVRGGDRNAFLRIRFKKGRSPRARGRPRRGCVLEWRMGSIPACAGETLYLKRMNYRQIVKERVNDASRACRRFQSIELVAALMSLPFAPPACSYRPRA